MHLAMMPRGNFSSRSLNMTSTVHCANMTMDNMTMTTKMTMPFRLIKTNTTTTNTSNLTLATTHHLTARSPTTPPSQNLSAGAILGIIVAIAIGCLACAALTSWALKSHKKAFQASGGTRVAVRGGANGGRHRHHSAKGDLERGTAMPSMMRSGAQMSYHSHGGSSDGVQAPARVYGGAGSMKKNVAGAVSFPGPRNGFGSAPKGPYQDGSRFSAVPTFEARGSAGGSGRKQGGGQQPSIHYYA